MRRGSPVESSDHYEVDEPEDWDRPTPPRLWKASHYVGDDLVIGEVNVTFDRKTFYNLFSDFPNAFTQEQLDILREDMPYWYDFFTARLTP